MRLNEVEGADFKYDNIFLNFLPKNTQIRYRKVLQVDKLDSADFKCGNCFFFNSSPEIPKLGIFGSQIQRLLFLHQALEQDKF